MEAVFFSRAVLKTAPRSPWYTRIKFLCSTYYTDPVSAYNIKLIIQAVTFAVIKSNPPIERPTQGPYRVGYLGTSRGLYRARPRALHEAIPRLVRAAGEIFFVTNVLTQVLALPAPRGAPVVTPCRPPPGLHMHAHHHQL